MSPVDTTFNLGRVHRALGVKGPVNPKYRVDNFSPVAVVADFSRSFAPESIEARAYYSLSQASTGGNSYTNWLFQSLGAGGSIVEQIAIVTSSANAVGFAQRLSASPWSGSGSTARLQMGGTDTKSTITTSTNQVPPVAFPSMLSPWSIGDSRLYIKPGEFLNFGSFSATGTAHTCWVGMVWRELEEQLGDA